MHCRISQQRWGGDIADYLPIHDFIDSTKSLCSDGRHRILHTLWGVNNVIVPIFQIKPIISDIDLSPSDFFNQMRFEYWMDNGMDYPLSAKKLQQLKQKVTV